MASPVTFQKSLKRINSILYSQKFNCRCDLEKKGFCEVTSWLNFLCSRLLVGFLFEIELKH